MADVKGELIGRVLTALGYDGTDFQNLKVDTDGHLQLDVLTSALPSGAATSAKQDSQQTVLELIQELRGALESVDSTTLRVSQTDPNDLKVKVHGNDGSNDYVLKTTSGGILYVYNVTAADLRVMAYGAEGADPKPIQTDADGYLQAEVRESALPSGAATSAKQDTHTALWKDQPFTYYGSVCQAKNATISGAGGYVQTVQISSGKLHCVTTVAAQNATTACTGVQMGVVKSGAWFPFYEDRRALAVAEWSTWSGHIWLDELQQIRVYWQGSAVADDCNIEYTGYRMTPD